MRKQRGEQHVYHYGYHGPGAYIRGETCGVGVPGAVLPVEVTDILAFAVATMCPKGVVVQGNAEGRATCCYLSVPPIGGHQRGRVYVTAEEV